MDSTRDIRVLSIMNEMDLASASDALRQCLMLLT